MKAIVKKYDARVKHPPFKFIKLDEFDVERDEHDVNGESFALKLKRKCAELGYTFRFYSLGENKGEIDVIVRGEMEQ